MVSNKEYIQYCLLFCFYQKKSALLTHTKLFMRHGENFLAVRMCANSLNDLKIFISNGI